MKNIKFKLIEFDEGKFSRKQIKRHNKTIVLNAANKVVEGEQTSNRFDQAHRCIVINETASNKIDFFFVRMSLHW